MKARNRPRNTLHRGLAHVIAIGWVFMLVIAGAETVALPLARDTTLFELFPQDNMGTQRDLPAGTLGNMGERKRARLLFQVDLANGLPSGAVIMAARYRILVTMAPESGRADSDFALHRVQVPWGEGDKRGDLPGGDSATSGEASWESRFHPDQWWSVPGGALGNDYAAEPSAETRVSAPRAYVLEFNALGLEDLRAMVANPEANHGWVLLSKDEGRAKTARRFAAREHRTDPPMLEIDYEVPKASAPSIPGIERDPETGEIIISTEASADGVYTLQSSGRLESTDWKNEDTAAEFVLGNVSFRKLLNETREFYRIMVGPSVR